MLQLSVAFHSDIHVMLWKYCASALVGLRHKNRSVRMRKTSRYFPKIPVMAATNKAGNCLIEVSTHYCWNTVLICGHSPVTPAPFPPPPPIYEIWNSGNKHVMWTAYDMSCSKTLWHVQMWMYQRFAATLTANILSWRLGWFITSLQKQKVSTPHRSASGDPSVLNGYRQSWRSSASLLPWLLYAILVLAQ